MRKQAIVASAVRATVEPLEMRTLFAVEAPTGFTLVTTVDIDGRTGVPDPGALIDMDMRAGQQYFYIASGKHQIRKNPTRYADAQLYQNYGGAWVPGTQPHLHVNGVTAWDQAPPGDFDPAGKRYYTKLVNGDGNKLNPWISDSYFDDNTGELTLQVYEVGVDLDIDSDNDNATSAPARTQAEDDVEDFQNNPAKPGKIVAVSNTDLDHDGVPDWGDGFNADGTAGNADNTPPTAAQGMHFVPVVFSMSKAIDLTKARLKLSYSASDPAEVEPTLESGAAGYRLSTEGALRLWTKDGSEERNKAAFNAGSPGHYVPPTGEGQYEPADLTKLGFTTTQRDVTLYLEAVSPSAQWGDQAIQIEIDPDGDGPAGFILTDRVRVTAVTVDADVDSDNTNAYATPDRNVVEDQMEAREKDSDNKRLPGKIVLVNDGDLDGDGVLDHADGFDADGVAGNADDTPPAEAQGAKFTPFVLEIPAPIDLSKARLQIDYDASVPGVGPGGSLRIWTKDGSAARSKNAFTVVDGGDYVPKKVGGDFYTPADLATLGLTNVARSKMLYIEGIAPSADAGDKTITVLIDPDGDGPAGFIAADVVRLTTIRVDLDVNGNKSLDDASDGTVNYLPGYEGTTAKLSTGATFNTATYVGQQMKLMVQGLGSGTVLDSITFKIEDVTSHAGYTGNASDPKLVRESIFERPQSEDFSFEELWDEREADGTMEAGKTTVPFWAKDYGGWAKVKVEAKIGANTFTLREFTVPNDSDGDKIADTWEREKVMEWNAQFGTTEIVSPAFFDATDDKELKDPDGTGVLTAQKTAGDHISIFDEYRGFILDGGGFDGAGANSHGGGHLRLNPALREVLWEVDHEAAGNLTNLPPGGVRDYLDLAARVLSHATRGAGIRAYYLFDDIALPATGFLPTDADPTAKQRDYLKVHRGRTDAAASVNDALKKYFTHAVILNDVPPNHLFSNAFTYSQEHTADRDERGIYLLTKETQTRASTLPGVNAAGYGGCSFAHEFLHMVITPILGTLIWDEDEHEIGNPGGTALMGDASTVGNNDETTVVITHTTQVEIDLAGNPALTP